MLQGVRDGDCARHSKVKEHKSPEAITIGQDWARERSSHRSRRLALPTNGWAHVCFMASLGVDLQTWDAAHVIDRKFAAENSANKLIRKAASKAAG